MRPQPPAALANATRLPGAQQLRGAVSASGGDQQELLELLGQQKSVLIKPSVERND